MPRALAGASGNLHAIRSCLAAGGATAGLLRGLSDSKIGKALAAMHERIGHPWTVERLVEEVGMSRSAFSSSFSELVGEPPMAYLSRWRLNRSAALLRTGGYKINQVAAAVGYDSEASLSRAFKRCFGLSPGAYRRHHAALNSDGDAGAASSGVPLYLSDFADGTHQARAPRNKPSPRSILGA
jgi:AraC-like DNA-binding protein